MNRVNTILSASALVLALSYPSWAQVTQTQTITLSGTVETIDQSRRTLNIKKADGSFETVEVPASAKRFDELKVGDKVTVTYNNTVSARLKPPGEAAVDTGREASTMGQEARPGGTTVVQRTMTATVSAIDKGSSTITSLVRTDGNTADVSSIRPCSIRLRLATRLTSPGTPTWRFRCSNPELPVKGCPNGGAPVAEGLPGAHLLPPHDTPALLKSLACRAASYSIRIEP